MSRVVLSYKFNDDGTVNSVTTKENDSKKRVSKKIQKEALKEASEQLSKIFGDRLPKVRF